MRKVEDRSRRRSRHLGISASRYLGTLGTLAHSLERRSRVYASDDFKPQDSVNSRGRSADVLQPTHGHPLIVSCLNDLKVVFPSTCRLYLEPARACHCQWGDVLDLLPPWPPTSQVASEQGIRVVSVSLYLFHCGAPYSFAEAFSSADGRQTRELTRMSLDISTQLGRCKVNAELSSCFSHHVDYGRDYHWASTFKRIGTWSILTLIKPLPFPCYYYGLVRRPYTSSKCLWLFCYSHDPEHGSARNNW